MTLKDALKKAKRGKNINKSTAQKTSNGSASVRRTPEGILTSAVKEYCTKKNIPCISDVNGTRIKGWSHIPDAIIGAASDDIYTKSVVIEIKPTRDGALKDLQDKEEYRRVKYLAAVYFNGKEMVGQKASWLSPTDGSVGFNLVGPELPLDRLLDGLYAVYQRTTNPAKQQIVEDVNFLIESKMYKNRDIFGVLSKCFCDQPKPPDLPYSLEQLWNKCEQVTGNSSDEREVLDNIVFRPQTRDARYELGQFITEYPWTLKLAELIVEEFDKHQDFTLYEPCVGTGAIASEVITLLFRKYGKRKAEKIIKEQMILGDIDPKMRAFAHVVLWNHTEVLFGKGINIKIQKSDLMTDSFDLSKMIVFGNYPFNAGNDYNYLAKIIRQQMKCGLTHMVLMGDSATFDPLKIQSSKIIGDEFLSKIETKYTTDDFQKVAVRISVVVFDKDKTVEDIVGEYPSDKFTTLEELGVKVSYIHDMAGKIRATRFKDKTPLRLDSYNPLYSMCFIQPRDLTTKNFPFRIPAPGAPVGSYEREVYDKWMKERGAYPVKRSYDNLLIIAVKSTTTNFVPLYYFDKFEGVIDDATVLQAPVGKLSISGLILQSDRFKTTLHKHFPKFQRVQRVLRVSALKTMPIPIETATNKTQFDRLCEIGQTLIIENKTDEALRKEADDIIEKLYNPPVVEED